MNRELLDALRHLLRPLASRVANSIARAVVQLADDGTKLQLLQLGVLAGETVDKAEHFQPYGFSSVPLPGAEAVVLFPNGDRSHPIVVAASDRRYRPTGSQPGEVTIYNNANARVILKSDGTIEIRSASGTAAALATKADLANLKSAIQGWTPVANDGGAALKTALTSLFSTWPAGTTKLKGE
jgi:phage baseplate assembly protein V